VDVSIGTYIALKINREIIIIDRIMCIIICMYINYYITYYGALSNDCICKIYYIDWSTGEINVSNSFLNLIIM